MFLPCQGYFFGVGEDVSFNCTPSPISTNSHLGQELAEQWAQITEQPPSLSPLHLRIKKKGDKDAINCAARKAFGPEGSRIENETKSLFHKDSMNYASFFCLLSLRGDK